MDFIQTFYGNVYYQERLCQSRQKNSALYPKRCVNRRKFM